MHVDTPQTRCRAGISRGDITPPVGIYHRMWGAAVHDRATGVHRRLTATLLWLQPRDGGREQGQLLIALDHCVLVKDEIGRMQQAVSQSTGIDPKQVHVTLSHTHAAGLMMRSRADFPGGDLIAPYLDSVAQRLAEWAPEAIASAQPATLAYGAGRCSLAANRDCWDERKQIFVCGLNPAGPSDDTVMVVRVVAETAKTIATIVNYACHPTTLAWDNTAISPDYVGALREAVEKETGAPCMFLQGASGDLGPREGFVGDHAVADRNGRQLAFAALSALEALPAPGSRYVYQGPVVSGAVIGAWKHEPLKKADLDRQAMWRCERWTVELPYRPDLPTMEETQRQQANWQGEESRAREKGDAIRARECRAKVEQMTRWLTRLRELPEGKTLSFPITLWQLGDAFWLIVPGEHYQALQTTLRGRFPNHPLMVATLTGDWLPGYVPTAATYGYGIYQESIALIAAGSAEVLQEEIARKMRLMLNTHGS
jgi:hypothetical protein